MKILFLEKIIKAMKGDKGNKKMVEKKDKIEKKPLPPGGEWKTVRGARVYIKDGKVLAGAGGKLDKMEISAIYEARQNRKTTDQIIFVGTEVKVGRERKKGNVVGETQTTFHIRYPDGTLRKEPKKNVRRADSYQLKLEDKLDFSNGGPGVAIEGFKDTQKKKQDIKERKEVGAAFKKPEELAEDVEDVMGETPFKTIPARLLKRDEQGHPVKETYKDPSTGETKERYVTFETDATEEELIRDHQGLLISEVVNPFAKKAGLSYIQREWFDKDGNPVDLYGDLVQTANIGFMQGLREWAYKQAQGETPEVTPLTQALLRAQTMVKRQAQDLFSLVKLPQRMMTPLAIITATKERLAKELEREPSLDELAADLQGNPVFNSFKMIEPPVFDQKKNTFVDRGGEIKDPRSKLEAIMNAQKLQQGVPLDQRYQNIRGDKPTTLVENVEDPTARDDLMRLEVEARNKDLRKNVNKVLNRHLSEDEFRVIKTRFGLGTKRKEPLTLEEVSVKLKISTGMAKKLSSSAMKKLSEMPEDTLTALRDLYMTKSLMKALYIMDMLSTLGEFGMDFQDLETRQRRVVSTGSVFDEIRKSLGVTEFVGGVTQTDDGIMQIRIIEYILPEEVPENLEKGFGGKTVGTQHKAIGDYFEKHPKKLESMSKKQTDENAAEAKKGGEIAWSRDLQLKNKGSAWITWLGNRILVGGNRQVLMDGRVAAHREKYGVPKGVEPEYEGQDIAKAEFKKIIEQKRGKWYDADPRKNTFIKEWRARHKDEKTFGEGKEHMKKHPDGFFVAENVETGKRVVYKVEIQEGNRGKRTTVCTDAFDPDADEKVNIGDFNAIYTYLYGKKAVNAYEVLVKNGNKADHHTMDVLDEDVFQRMRKQTTSGAKDAMVHTSFNEVTPETMKKLINKDGKMVAEVIPYEGHRIFECDLGDGTVSRFEITQEGKFADSVIQRLINPSMPIGDANDLYTVLKNGVGNTAWVTISSSKLEGLHHHVKLKYDGQGAPVVTGGAFDGFRFQDANHVSDPEEKQQSLFRGGQPVRPGYRRTVEQKIPIAVGNDVMVRDPEDRRKWIRATVVDRVGGHWKLAIEKENKTWKVRMPEEMIAQGKVFPSGHVEGIFKESEMRQATERYNIATEAPIIDEAKGGMLNITVPKDMIDLYQVEYGLKLDENGRADISVSQYMELRDRIGSFSFTGKGRNLVESIYRHKASVGKVDMQELIRKYDPNSIDGYRDDSFVKQVGFYNTTLEGVEHLMNVKKGIVGHGMGTGKTLLGINGSMKLRDEAIKAGKKPGKTLIVCPAGIMDTWNNEIAQHTTVGAVVVGGSDSGEFGTEKKSKIVGEKDYNAKHEEHFALMSYDRFMRNPEKLMEIAKAGGFSNIIFDEAHAIKTPEGNRNKVVKKLAKNLDHVWALTGTPMDNEVQDAYHIIDAVTGGAHTLGTSIEFKSKYMNKNGSKYVGMNEDKMAELGTQLSQYTHFRNGYEDTVIPAIKGKPKVEFPKIREGNTRRGAVKYAIGSIQTEIAGRMVNQPLPITEKEKSFYERYNKMSSELLTEKQLEGLKQETEGFSSEKTKNYLPAVQRLQKFTNAPVSADAFYKIKKDADGKSTGIRDYPSIMMDGYKRYYKRNPDGTQSKELLPPIHHNNPKAEALKSKIITFLDGHDAEMKRRHEYNKTSPRDAQRPLYPPKMVLTSGYTTFGTDVIESVLRDIEKDRGHHYGSFTGDTHGSRDATAKAFREDRKTAFMVISDAGKEGINLGNAQALIHYDQDFNPNKMAQKTARILRSNSHEFARVDGRKNAVMVESLVMPGTVEDSILRAQDRKMYASSLVEQAARDAEGVSKPSDYTPVYAGAQTKWRRKKKALQTKPLVFYIQKRR